jgi:hypothetical protein
MLAGPWRFPQRSSWCPLKYEIAARERQHLVYWENVYLQDVIARGTPGDFLNGPLGAR